MISVTNYLSNLNLKLTYKALITFISLVSVSLRFREAFECAKKLRINLNFIYDYNPKVDLYSYWFYMSFLMLTLVLLFTLDVMGNR